MPSRRKPITLLIALAAVACSHRTRRTPDDTLVMLMEAPATTTDPRNTLSNYDTKLAHLIASGLTTVDNATMAPELLLAEKIDRVDDLTYDVTLKPGLLFSDGNPVTAADVAWTYQSVLDDPKAVSYHQLTERFTKIEATGARTTRFHMVAPLATFQTDLDFGIVERAAATKGGRFPNGIAIGCGPYVLDRLDDTGAWFHANPRWPFAPPKIAKLEIKVVRDASARILMLVGGSADLAQNSARLDLVDDIAQQWRVHVESGPSALLTYLMMNNDDPILKDVRVRQAIALALDRDAIIKQKLGGHAVLATGLLPPGHWAYEPNVPHWRRDLPRAKQLLEEAGYHDPDGDGPEPRFTLTYKTSSDSYRVALANVIAAQLREAGIAVEVSPFEFATFFKQVKQGAYQLASMQTSDITEPDYFYTYFNSVRIPGKKNPDDGNRWRYRNPRVDALTELGRRQLDRGARRTTYSEVQRILATELPVIPLWHEDNIVVENRTVTGYSLLPNARYTGVVTTTKSE
ncbi:MAG TPA: ABC transporter substrate-binding protein [Kofleriaceae bacterium]|nr:ABC transporter substrate-binding protein [Kofleriaceae bacterium]